MVKIEKVAIHIRKPNYLGGSWVFFLAERMGFEPMCACAQTDFESAPL